MELRNGPGAEGRGIVLNLPGVQEIGIEGLNYEGVVLISAKLFASLW